MSELTGDLLREVARVQRARTLQEVRDLIESTETQQRDYRGLRDRSSCDFKADLVRGLEGLREAD